MYPNLPPIDPATGQPYTQAHAMAYPGQQPFPQPGGYPYQQGLPVHPVQHPGVQIHPTPVAMGYPTQQVYPNVTPTAVPSAPPAYGFPAAPAGPTVTPTPYAGMPSSTPTPYIPQPVIDWVRIHPKNAEVLSERAVVAGYEGHDGSPLWIIRAPFRGDVIPGKLAIKYHVAFVAFGGEEHRVEDVEVEYHHGSPLWVIRANFFGTQIPGKLAIEHHAAFIPYRGFELAVYDIEVCCAPAERVRWYPSSEGRLLPNAVVGGRTSDGEPLYIGRVHHEKSLTPGKVHPSQGVLYISFAGREFSYEEYEVLCTV